MTHVPDRNEPNNPGLDPTLAFKADDGVPMPVKQQPSPAYSLAPTDFYKRLACTASDPTVITIPADAMLDMPLGALVTVGRYGSGSVTIVPGGGVTLSKVAGFASPVRVAEPNGAAILQKTAANAWYVFGGITKG